MLVVLGGLPGVGKTTIARELARRLAGVYVRIDSIEQGIRDCGVIDSRLDVAGYTVGYAVAAENLRLGQTVVADSVNPMDVTRDAWADVAKRAQAKILEVEIVCSNGLKHQQRVESRATDIPGSRLPNWQEVLAHEYHPWNRARIVIDTAHQSVERSVEMLLEAIRKRKE
jgi:predicted kinase